jgi:hypothetical protein
MRLVRECMRLGGVQSKRPGLPVLLGSVFAELLDKPSDGEQSGRLCVALICAVAEPLRAFCALGIRGR